MSNQGTNGNDRVNGSDQASGTYYGFGIGSDTLIGGILDDRFYLTVDAQADRIDGGSGEGRNGDSVNYDAADRGLKIDLDNGIATATFGSRETTVTYLSNIENVVGTEYADFITGNSANNVIEGGGGNDTIDGGEGQDTVSYEHSAQGVKIDLSVSLASSRDGSADRLASIENALGSTHDDRIVGSSGDNVLTGNGGSDTFVFTALTGNDRITDFRTDGDARDFIEFRGAFESTDDLVAHTESNGNDTVIRIDDHNSITLVGVELNDFLHNQDFYFVV